jgi:uncharacterized membrane protein
MAENGLRKSTAVTKHRTPLRVLGGLTFLFTVGSALCGGWWKYQRDKARNEIGEAARSGAWADYQAALRNEWPALDWFIASLILLVFAIGVGAVTLLYWTITRRERQRSDSK